RQPLGGDHLLPGCGGVCLALMPYGLASRRFERGPRRRSARQPPHGPFGRDFAVAGRAGHFSGSEKSIGPRRRHPAGHTGRARRRGIVGTALRTGGTGVACRARVAVLRSTHGAGRVTRSRLSGVAALLLMPPSLRSRWSTVIRSDKLGTDAGRK